jgi:hypothetical protein
LLRKCFWSVACGHASCACPAHPLGLATLRVALALRGLPVRPQGAPSYRAVHHKRLVILNGSPFWLSTELNTGRRPLWSLAYGVITCQNSN